MTNIIPIVNVFPISAFTDNYIWTLVRGRDCAVVDPGDATPVLAELAARKLNLRAILITHHHADHTGGLRALAAQFDAPVFGPRAESARVAGMTQLLAEGDRFEALGLEFRTIEVPGHTSGHVALYAPGAPGLLFCGDTLFSGGCGRLFEGTPAQMLASLTRLAQLPPETRVHCGHEYTRANLAFAQAVLPEDPDVADYIEVVDRMRAAGQPSLPSNIGVEQRINVFLRAAEPEVRAAAERWAGQELAQPVDVFAALRRWKDGFRATT